MVLLDLYEILQKETDENHRMSQKQISERLKAGYGEEADRKTIRKCLMQLSEFDSNIQYDDSRTRVNKRGESENISSEWYYAHPFTEPELRVLIDSLLFSNEIPYCQCRELVTKLKALSSNYFRANVDNIRNLPETRPENKQIFYILDVLDEAIEKGRQVSFHYCEYHSDKKMYERRDDADGVKEYMINPYRIVATNGRFYLICNNDKYENLSYYRIDRMKDIMLSENRIKPLESLPGCEKGLNLPEHMAEHIYMMSGESEKVTFRADRFLITEIMDWFGKDIRFFDETESSVHVTVRVNVKAMFFWLMQYGQYVEVERPEALRRKVADAVAQMTLRYTQKK